jgi:hypothetical protein
VRFWPSIHWPIALARPGVLRVMKDAFLKAVSIHTPAHARFDRVFFRPCRTLVGAARWLVQLGAVEQINPASGNGFLSTIGCSMSLFWPPSGPAAMLWKTSCSRTSTLTTQLQDCGDRRPHQPLPMVHAWRHRRFSHPMPSLSSPHDAYTNPRRSVF